MIDRLNQLLRATGISEPLTAAEGSGLASAASTYLDLRLYPRSVVAVDGVVLGLAQRGVQKVIVAVTKSADKTADLVGDKRVLDDDGDVFHVTVAPSNNAGLNFLRQRLPYLKARRLGLTMSAGCGDRLGLATPGHIQAVRAFEKATGETLAVIAAQQSVRENSRTGRTPQEVMDDAARGIFEEGWRDGFGADADHLKTPEDIAPWAEAGFTFYTIDPGEHVDDEAETASADALMQKVQALPWDVLEGDADALFQRFAEPVDIGTEKVSFPKETILKAAAKYGRAVAHTATMYRHLVSTLGEDGFELEVSVDETATVTSVEEHIYIASELKRLGVRWVSLAPRYVGEFEKGVDYIGDIDEFQREFARHAAVARTFGPYKLSLHSGSDKFSIYGIVAELTEGLLHLKTAGTSYLEALRTLASANPGLFKQVMDFAMGRYETDRATYFVSGQLDRVPDYKDMTGQALLDLIDQFDARQVLHVTFGSVLNEATFKDGLYAALRSYENTHYNMVATHFGKHFTPLAGSRREGTS